MVAKLTMIDNVNFINKQPVIGEEKVKVRFRSASAEQATEYVFAITGCDDFEFSPSLMELRYTLWGSSVESITDFDKAVQKSYKTPMHEIVKDIYTSYLASEKTLTVERCEGRTGLIIPNLTPFQALRFLAKRAISAENPTDVFMSYESTTGFNFQTVANMIKNGKAKADSAMTHRFRYQHGSLIDPSQESLEGDIIQFQQHRKFEMTDLNAAGYFASRVLKFNLDSGEVTPTDFKLKDKIGSWKLSHSENGRNIHSDDYMGQHTESHKQFLIPYDPYRLETSMADVIAEKAAYYANLLQNQFELVVPGADTVEAGNLIFVSMPEIAVPEASDSHFQNQTHGYFLVGDVVHSITARSKFTSKFVAFKDSFSSEGEG